MRVRLLLSALLPLLFLTGCGDGWPKVGDRVLYGLGERGKEEIKGQNRYFWIAAKTENTITIRELRNTVLHEKARHPDGEGQFAYTRDEAIALSRVPWVEKHVDQVPMPTKDWVGPLIQFPKDSLHDVYPRAIEALKNQR